MYDEWTKCKFQGGYWRRGRRQKPDRPRSKWLEKVSKDGHQTLVVSHWIVMNGGGLMEGSCSTKGDGVVRLQASTSVCCSMFLCVNVYCHRVTTQLQLINIIIIILCGVVQSMLVAYRRFGTFYRYHRQGSVLGP